MQAEEEAEAGRGREAERRFLNGSGLTAAKMVFSTYVQYNSKCRY